MAELPFDVRKELEGILDGFEEALELRDLAAVEVYRDVLHEFFARYDTGLEDIPHDDFFDDEH